MWLFVSVYLLCVVCCVDDVVCIWLEIELLMCGSVLVGLNMENYEMCCLVVYVDEGVLSGLVVNLLC